MPGQGMDIIGEEEKHQLYILIIFGFGLL